MGVAGRVTALICVVVGVTFTLLLVLVVYKDTVTVQTTNAGLVTGKIINLKDGKTMVYEFHNIRYAEAPVDELRFKPPVRHIKESPKIEVSATYAGVVKCIQASTGEGDEDCLMLTVRSGNLTASKPVIMWIHGGGLADGYGMEKGYSFDSELTHQVDAVTVNINYRLGFLGFSSVRELWDEDKGIYANNGIRDMIAALDWIQDNIAAFGGDPKAVTIMGQNGGATAVLALICSPLANDKFHAAIALSPAPEMRFTHEKGNEFQRSILEQLKCDQDTDDGRKQCLIEMQADKFSVKRGVDVMQAAAYFDFPKSQGDAAEYGGLIMIDPTVVTVSPRQLKSADFTPSKPLPIIVSNCAQENYKVKLWTLKSPFDTMTDLRENLKPLFENLGADEDVMEEVIALYPEQDPTTVWSLMTCDMRSTCPSNDVAEAMSAASNRDIYRLYVRHNPSSDLPAFHGYDSWALFGYNSDLEFKPIGIDIRFQNRYIEIIKRFSGKTRETDIRWTSFPSKSLILVNSVTDQIANYLNDKPQKTQCEKLTELDLITYGWQHK